MATKLIILLFTILWAVAINGQQTRTKRMYALCPPKFVKIGNECYFISTDKANWLDAHFECKDRASKLAEPFKFEDRRLRKHLIASDSDHTPKWIGGIFNWERHVWQWGYNGRDMTYQAFSQMKPGSRQDLRFHCAVLNPDLKYRWSSRSCVDRHHFICQHRMPYVNERNRDKIYNKWNETFPNEYANEIEVLVSDKENQGNEVNRSNRHLNSKPRRFKGNRIPQDPLNPAFISNGATVGRPSRHDRNQTRRTFTYGAPWRQNHYRHKVVYDGMGRPIRKKRPKRPIKKVPAQELPKEVDMTSKNEIDYPIRHHPVVTTTTPEPTTTTTTTTTEQIITTLPHRHHHKINQGHHERHHKHHEDTYKNEVLEDTYKNEVKEETIPITTTTMAPTTTTTTSTTTTTTTTTEKPTTAAPVRTETPKSEEKPKHQEDSEVSTKDETMSAQEKKARRDKLKEKLRQLSPEQLHRFYKLRKERMEKKLAERNIGNK